jgi:hypothetical protein
MDDLQATGSGKEEHWKLRRNTRITCTYLVIQDASRNIRGSYKTPVPWMGSMAYTHVFGESMRVLFPQKKWDSVKQFIYKLGGTLEIVGGTVGGSQCAGKDYILLDLNL